MTWCHAYDFIVSPALYFFATWGLLDMIALAVGWATNRWGS